MPTMQEVGSKMLIQWNVAGWAATRNVAMFIKIFICIANNAQHHLPKAPRETMAHRMAYDFMNSN